MIASFADDTTILVINKGVVTEKISVKYKNMLTKLIIELRNGALS